MTSKSVVTERVFSFYTSAHYTWLAQASQGTKTCTFNSERWSLKDELRLAAGGLKLPSGPVTMVLYLLAARGWAGWGGIYLWHLGWVQSWSYFFFFPGHGSGVHCGCFQPKNPNMVVSCRSFADIYQISLQISVTVIAEDAKKKTKNYSVLDSCKPHQNTDDQNHGVGAGIVIVFFFFF